MADILGESLKKIKRTKVRHSRMMALVLVLSLIVSVDVFWSLRQPGWTLTGDAHCGITEHTHDENCNTQVCICDQTVDVHIHDENCYETRTVEQQENRFLHCEETEQPHNHNDSCFEITISEPTTEKHLLCENTDETHIHEDGCYEIVEIEGSEEKTLICERVSDPHEHTDDCYTVEIIEAYEEQVLVCTQTETEHIHTDTCYEWHPCELEEHSHKIECYADSSADVETALDWQNMFANYPYTKDLRKNLVGIAKMQVGYTESTRNFEVDEDGNRNGYTRYGAWYGSPYRKNWSASFVSFCLNYAGAKTDENPINTGASAMISAWEQLGKYAPAGEYTPVAGDLAFFTNGTVGIIAQVQGGTMYVIRGDREEAVLQESFSLDSSSIKGWGCTVGTVASAAKPTATPAPTAEPTAVPTEEPMEVPTEVPTEEPTETPTEVPTEEPTVEPTEIPTEEPTVAPTEVPTEEPTVAPTEIPTEEPTVAPTEVPTEEPTVTPTEVPTEEPTVTPTEIPTEEPTVTPTEIPTEEPTVTPTVEPTLEPTAEPTVEPTEEPATVGFGDIDLLDISNGPAFFMFTGGERIPQMQQYSLKATRSATPLMPYLTAHHGDYSYTLHDDTNQNLDPDNDHNYIVQPGKAYKLTLTLNCPEGFAPGTYEYQIPNGLMVNGGEGTFELEGTTVGTWTVTDTGLITMVFNNEMNDRTDVTISATMGIHFAAVDDPLDFDGKITVTVEPPPVVTNPTVVNKWGHQGGTPGSNGTDPTKIYWNIEIIGNKDSNIPGNLIVDSLVLGEWSHPQHFTQSDIEAGLSFGASSPDGNWHTWVVTTDDPHLVWTENEWTYKMPQTVICNHCGELTLGNEGWKYYIHFSSTPDSTNTAGALGYENKVSIDNAHRDAWVNFTHADIPGIINKSGSFSSDASSGAFLWEFRATIPASPAGKKAYFTWYIMDNMRVYDSNGNFVRYMGNDANLARVTATYNGTTIDVPRIQDATGTEPFAWNNGWSTTEDGVTYSRAIELLCLCKCTPETCHWGGGCDPYWYKNDDGTSAQKNYCQCWVVEDEVTFTFTYETTDMSVIEDFGGHGFYIQNTAELLYIPEGAQGGASVDSSKAEVDIPGLIKKELTHHFDGYIAHYVVTVNEAKQVLTNDLPLNIHDVMTQTLTYISGSMEITTEDADGNQSTLQYGKDYTLTYDGTGNEKDENGKPVHVLDIVILRPQPVKYILDYDTTLVIPAGTTESVKYGNSATITLWGEEITDSSTEMVFADINISAKNYKVELYKTSKGTNALLPGATFGLFNDKDGLIATQVTDENGHLMFETNIIEGIILREHVLYYLKELSAPPGYKLDDTKYWFCFCNSTGETCADFDQIAEGVDAVRIPNEQIGKFYVSNEALYYTLPETGGPGIYPLILASVACIVAPLVYRFTRRRKQEGRDTG